MTTKEFRQTRGISEIMGERLITIRDRTVTEVVTDNPIEDCTFNKTFHTVEKAKSYFYESVGRMFYMGYKLDRIV